MRVIRHASTDGNARGLLNETYLNLSMDSANPRFVETIVNDASVMVQVAAVGANRPAANGTVSGGLDLSQTQLNTLGEGQTLALAVGTATATLTWDAGDDTTLSQLRG